MAVAASSAASIGASAVPDQLAALPVVGGFTAALKPVSQGAAAGHLEWRGTLASLSGVVSVPTGAMWKLSGVPNGTILEASDNLNEWRPLQSDLWQSSTPPVYVRARGADRPDGISFHLA
jgi:hypothetical protein